MLNTSNPGSSLIRCAMLAMSVDVARRTTPVSSSTVHPCFLNTSRAGAKWARMPTVSRTSSEASCVRLTSASVSSSTYLMPSFLLSPCDPERGRGRLRACGHGGELIEVSLDEVDERHVVLEEEEVVVVVRVAVDVVSDDVPADHVQRGDPQHAGQRRAVRGQLG